MIDKNMITLAACASGILGVLGYLDMEVGGIPLRFGAAALLGYVMLLTLQSTQKKKPGPVSPEKIRERQVRESKDFFDYFDNVEQGKGSGKINPQERQ